MEKERYKEKIKDDGNSRCLKTSAMTMDKRYFIQNLDPFALNKNQNQNLIFKILNLILELTLRIKV